MLSNPILTGQDQGATPPRLQSCMGLPQERQIGLRAIIEIKIDVSRVIFEVWSSILYLWMSYEHSLASRVNQSIGEHNSSWNSLRFINFQWSQRIVLLSYTTVCRITFQRWIFVFQLVTGWLLRHLGATEKKYFGHGMFFSSPHG